MKPKIIVVVGPTASGKSDLAVEIARKYRKYIGEVISADSRQVYRGLNIGSGKITKKEMLGVPHHLLDVADPKKVFTVAKFKKLGQEKIAQILKRNHLPIICGGTGFYIQALVDNIELPEVDPNPKLRKKLDGYNTDKLFSELQKLDPSRAKNIDPHNRPRLIRAIEIARVLGKVPRIKQHPLYDPLFIGIDLDSKKLREKIHIRLLFRMKKGMVQEAKKLHTKGLSWKRMETLGLEYCYLALYLQKKISKNALLESIESEIVKYTKRQMTWFTRDKRILWISPQKKKAMHSAIASFLK